MLTEELAHLQQRLFLVVAAAALAKECSLQLFVTTRKSFQQVREQLM
jgi:hypothetical protein